MKCSLRAGLIVCAFIALCACGQKGPLVLPDAVKRKHNIPVLPAAAAPKNKDSTAAPAESTPAANPAGSSTAPQP